MLPEFLQSRFPKMGGSAVARPIRGRWWIATACAIVLLAAVVYWYAWPAFRGRLIAHSLRMARGYIADKDYRAAEITLQGELQDHPHNHEARRLLAELYGRVDASRELAVWQQLVELEPEAAGNQIGLARAALHTRNLALARGTLESIGPDGRANAEYLQVAAELARLAGDRKALERALAALVRLDPSDDRTAYSLALLQLTQNDTRAGARERLVEWARGDRLRIQANLELINDLNRNKDSREIGLLSAAILAPHPGLSQNWVGGSAKPDLFNLVEYMKRQPHPTVEDVLALSRWLRGHGFAREAIDWLESLAPALRTNPVVMEESARDVLALGDWSKLEALLLAGAWGPLPEELVTKAFSARQQRADGELSRSIVTWNETFALARDSAASLNVRVRLAGAFGWPRETEQALWQVVQFAPGEVQAWQALAAAAEAESSAEKLVVVMTAWAENSPADSPVHCDLVLLKILLGRSDAANRAALKNYAEMQSRTAAATAALALDLARQGHQADAAKMVEPIAGSPALPPRVNLACGLVLAQGPYRDLAQKCLDLAAQVRLLPEEEQQLKAARAAH